MGTGFVMVENLFRRHPPGEHPLHRNPIFILLSVKSVVPTAVFRFDSHEIAGFDEFCLAPLSWLRKI